MRIKILIITTIVIVNTISCTSYLDSLSELDHVKEKNNLSITEKEMLFPYHDYTLNSISVPNITDEETRWLMSTLDLMRVVINSDAFETEVLKTDFYAGRDISSTVPEYQIKNGGKLSSKRLLDVIRRSPIVVNIVERNDNIASPYHHYGAADLYSSEHASRATANLQKVALSSKSVLSGGIQNKINVATELLRTMMFEQGFSPLPANKIRTPFKTAANNKKVQKDYIKFSTFHETKFDYLLEKGI